MKLNRTIAEEEFIEIIDETDEPEDVPKEIDVDEFLLTLESRR